MLKQWKRRSKIVLEANPVYRGFTWDFAAKRACAGRRPVAAMKGKSMPQVGRVEISIIEESQTQWLAFGRTAELRSTCRRRSARTRLTPTTG